MNDFFTITTMLGPASKNENYLIISLEQKRELLLAANTRADFGGVVTECIANVRGGLQTMVTLATTQSR
jgi:hypothetical protein